MADDSQELGQADIDKLFPQAGGGAVAAGSSGQGKPGADISLGQDEIEALMQAGAAAQSRPSAQSANTPRAPGNAALGNPQGDIELLLSQAEAALASVTNPADEMPSGVAPFALRDFAGSPASTDTATLDLVRDVQLDMKIELGRTHMYLEDVLRLRKGAVVPLDKLAGDPVDIFVNGRLIARGEILVLNDNFCVRVAELLVGETAVA